MGLQDGTVNFGALTEPGIMPVFLIRDHWLPWEISLRHLNETWHEVELMRISIQPWYVDWVITLDRQRADEPWIFLLAIAGQLRWSSIYPGASISGRWLHLTPTGISKHMQYLQKLTEGVVESCQSTSCVVIADWLLSPVRHVAHNSGTQENVQVTIISGRRHPLLVIHSSYPHYRPT